MIDVCTENPVCAVREARPWSDEVRCQVVQRESDDVVREWRCIVLQANGHAFRFKVERRYETYGDAEYVGGWLRATRVRGSWTL